jgi:hypothetical protein
LAAGDEIAVFTPDGECVGAAVWEGHPTYVTAHGNAEDGLAPGDSLHVRFWDRSAGQELLVTGTLSGNGGKYEPGRLITAESLSVSSPIPVAFANVDASSREDGDVLVRWKTLSETNNAFFEVQRTTAHTASASWESVGTREGAGTTDEPQTYRLTDNDALFSADSLRYRVRQVDTDGTAHFSKTVAVTRSAVARPRLFNTFPNPATQGITVQLAVPSRGSASTPTLRLFDVLGREVKTYTVDEGGRQKISLGVSDLSSGMYFLRLRAASTTQTRRVTVVR